MTEFSEKQKEFINELFTKLHNTINENTQEIRQELKEQITKIREETTEKVKKLQQKVHELEEKNEKLQHEILNTERKLRKNNLIIYGIEKEEKNIFEYTLDIFRNILGLDIDETDLNNVYRIGTKESKKRPVIVELISFQKKLLVLNNAKKLKGKNIYIARDQCLEDRQQNKILIEHQNKARAKGQTAYIKRGKLYIDEKEFSIDQLEGEEAPTETNNKHQADNSNTRRKDEKDRKKARPGANKEQKTTDSRIQTRSAIDAKKAVQGTTSKVTTNTLSDGSVHTGL